MCTYARRKFCDLENKKKSSLLIECQPLKTRVQPGNGLCTKVPLCMLKNEMLTWEKDVAVISGRITPRTVVGSKQFISMVDGVGRRGISGGAETDVGELYSISPLTEVCLLGRRVPKDPEFIFHLHHQGLWFDRLPLPWLCLVSRTISNTMSD